MIRKNSRCEYSTAVGRLRTVADELTSHAEWRDDLIAEAYVYGELLDAPPTLERIALAFVVDLPPEEATWLAHPAAPEAAIPLLRFEKWPITWHWPLWPGRCGTMRSSRPFGSGQ